MAVFCVVAFLALSAPEPPARLDAAAHARAQGDVAEVRRQIRAIDRRSRAEGPQPFTLRLTEDDINDLLATDDTIAGELQRNSIDRAWVRIAHGSVYLSVLRPGPSALPSVTLTAAVRPVVQADRTIGFRVESVTMGRVGIPAPSALRAALADALERAIKNELAPNATINAFRAEDGSLTISGVTADRRRTTGDG